MMKEKYESLSAVELKGDCKSQRPEKSFRSEKSEVVAKNA